MKPLHTFIVSTAAVAGLFGAAASHATDVAKLPLKAAVLAKPNVIFAMDDSGSMDWELLLDTSSGAMWWNGATAWNGATQKPLATSGMVPYAYLFPVGTAAGAQLYAFNNWWGQAVPPTNQFAWLRSSAFNPIYYDSSVDYAHWAPAYLDGANKAYADAPVGGAYSHPNYQGAGNPKLAVGASYQSGSTGWNTDGYRFYVQAGMVVPAGSRVNSSSAGAGGAVCTGGAVTLTADQTVAAGRACWAAMPYYPATFWQPEVCAVGANCVNRPDGAGTLKRYEIKAGNTFPSGRTHTKELENFANWFTYYRKRKLMLGGSMGIVMENITGLRLGVVPFNNHAAVTMYDADAPNSNENQLVVAGKFYKNSMSAVGTPTHATMAYIGTQFDTNTNIVEYACQRNNSFVVTDGFSNTVTIVPPAWDAGKSAATFGAGAPYQTTFDGTQADIALRHYTNRLRKAGANSLAAGKVPPSGSDAPGADKNKDLHINTYGITLGVRGSLWPSATDPYDVAPAWIMPAADDPSLIDDLWHATINGRGKMYLASSPQETAASIQAGLDDILSQTGAQGGIAVSTVNLPRGDDLAYFGTYNPAGWIGDLAAYPIDSGTGVVSTGDANRLWSASNLLTARDWTTRIMASSSGGTGVEFTIANVAAAVNPGATYGADGDVIDYLRGNRTLEGTAMRKRGALMGAVINSEPAVDRENKVAYVQSGEGMLHAFDTTKGADAGRELWAFVPGSVLSTIGASTQRGYVFRTLLDGSPVVGNLSGGDKLLVAGMGVAGNSFHAIDVTAPRAATAAALAGKVKWDFPSAADAGKMGLAIGRPVIVRTKNHGHVVLLTSGYNTGDGKGRLWMVKPADGTVIKEFEVPTDGLAQVSPFGKTDGSVQYVYGGDLGGNVWRFDLDEADLSPLKGQFLLATLKNAANTAQPVTAAPELALIEGRRVIIVGTGRILGVSDFGISSVQTMYVMADDGVLLNDARDWLIQQLFDGTNVTVSDVDWTAAATRGWYLDLPAGEQINTRPTIAFGALAWVSNTVGKSDCSASSRLYVVDLKTGGTYGDADYSSLVSDSATSSAVTALRTVDGKIVGSGQDSDGKPWTRDISTLKKVPATKNAWRDVRR